jgi:hypothetical protein
MGEQESGMVQPSGRSVESVDDIRKAPAGE